MDVDSSGKKGNVTLITERCVGINAFLFLIHSGHLKLNDNDCILQNDGYLISKKVGFTTFIFFSAYFQLFVVIR